MPPIYHGAMIFLTWPPPHAGRHAPFARRARRPDRAAIARAVTKP